MKTVRGKLIALVLACVAPAMLGAVLEERAAEGELLQQVQQRMDAANLAFADEYDDYQKNALLALTLTEQSGRLQKVLAERDAAAVSRFVDRLAGAYKYRLVVAADSAGQMVAVGNPERGKVAALSAQVSPAFADLLAGKTVAGLVPLALDGPTGKVSHALVAAVPVRFEGVQVGALALLTPMTDRYLEHLQKKLTVDLAVSANGKLVAATNKHPAPQLRTTEPTGVLTEVASKLFAVKTFAPPKLQRPGLVVEVTSSNDVTALRDRVRADLYLHLAGLGAVLAMVLAFALRFASRVGRTVQAISAAATEVKAGRYVDAPVTPSGDELEQLGRHFNEMVEGLRERDHLKETFGRYVTRQVADHLMKNHQVLGGELVPVTVLFSDIRSFTTISESMEPRALLDFLNEYFTGMVESVLQHHGVVDKFIGDAIMAIWGAPVTKPNDAENAVLAALEMRQALHKFNQGRGSRAKPIIRIGMGLNTGEVLAGQIGSLDRLEYTVIGDTVNLASRMEGLNKALGTDILITQNTYDLLKKKFTCIQLHKVKVKGKAEAQRVYAVMGKVGDTKAPKTLAELHKFTGLYPQKNVAK